VSLVGFVRDDLRIGQLFLHFLSCLRSLSLLDLLLLSGCLFLLDNRRISIILSRLSRWLLS
jgi:hypothetical protein